MSSLRRNSFQTKPPSLNPEEEAEEERKAMSKTALKRQVRRTSGFGLKASSYPSPYLTNPPPPHPSQRSITRPKADLTLRAWAWETSCATGSLVEQSCSIASRRTTTSGPTFSSARQRRGISTGYMTHFMDRQPGASLAPMVRPVA